MQNDQLQNVLHKVQSYLDVIILDLEFLSISVERKKLISIILDAVIIEELEDVEEISEYSAFRLGYKLD